MQKEELTIERRIRAIEDRLEIYNLIAGHPPSADTGSAAYAEAVFTADGVFDRGPDLSGRGQQGDRRQSAKRRPSGSDCRRTGAFHFAAACHD